MVLNTPRKIKSPKNVEHHGSQKCLRGEPLEANMSITSRQQKGTPKESTCARGAGIDGGVSNVHTGTFWSDTRREGGRGEEEVIVSSAYQNLPRWGFHVLQRFITETLGSLPFPSFRIDREQHVPTSSNNSLYLMKLLS